VIAGDLTDDDRALVEDVLVGGHGRPGRAAPGRPVRPRGISGEPGTGPAGGRSPSGTGSGTPPGGGSRAGGSRAAETRACSSRCSSRSPDAVRAANACRRSTARWCGPTSMPPATGAGARPSRSAARAAAPRPRSSSGATIGASRPPSCWRPASGTRRAPSVIWPRGCPVRARRHRRHGLRRRHDPGGFAGEGASRRSSRPTRPAGSTSCPIATSTGRVTGSGAGGEQAQAVPRGRHLLRRDGPLAPLIRYSSGLGDFECK
jgi:hypothetical protein